MSACKLTNNTCLNNINLHTACYQTADVNECLQCIARANPSGCLDGDDVKYCNSLAGSCDGDCCPKFSYRGDKSICVDPPATGIDNPAKICAVNFQECQYYPPGSSLPQWCDDEPPPDPPFGDVCLEGEKSCYRWDGSAKQHICFNDGYSCSNRIQPPSSSGSTPWANRICCTSPGVTIDHPIELTSILKNGFNCRPAVQSCRTSQNEFENLCCNMVSNPPMFQGSNQVCSSIGDNWKDCPSSPTY